MDTITIWTANTVVEDKTDLVEDILVARGIERPAMFLSPNTFYNEIDPAEFKNMAEAVDCVLQHQDKRILVVFDVDVDGITSGTIVYKSLTDLGWENIDWVIGDGKRHGIEQYGVEYLSGYDIIIACDSLSNEYDTYEALHKAGTAVVLLDHHSADKTSEHAFVVNSEMHDSPNASLSGAGVAWKFVCLLYDRLEKDPPPYADLAAIGLVADMMDMSVIDNRVICDKGFNTLENMGVDYILGQNPFNAESVSFTIAPLVNACQRMGENELAASLFMETNRKKMPSIKKKMEAAKTNQKNQVAELMQALDIVVSENGFMIGIMPKESNRHLTGLVANAFCGDQNINTIILYDNDDSDEYSGSLRGVDGFSFKDIINSTALATAEGHQAAAGIRLLKKDLQAFQEALQQTFADFEYVPPMKEYDCDLSATDLSLPLVKSIIYANRITGTGFPRLTFKFTDIQAASVDYLGKQQNHTKIIDRHKGFEFIKWNDTNPVDDYDFNKTKTFTVIGTPSINNFRGQEKVQCIAEVVDYDLDEEMVLREYLRNAEDIVQQITDEYDFTDETQRIIVKTMLLEQAYKQIEKYKGRQHIDY